MNERTVRDITETTATVKILTKRADKVIITKNLPCMCGPQSVAADSETNMEGARTIIVIGGAVEIRTGDLVSTTDDTTTADVIGVGPSTQVTVKL
jgi:hypothetical protein